MDLDALQFLLSPWALGLLGLCIGSFLNVVVHRIPRMLEHQWRVDSAATLDLPPPEASADAGLSLTKPGSRCPHCGHMIRWYENIPVLSWLVLRGRCSACKAPIAWRYPLTELACGALFLVLGRQFGEHPATLAWCGFAAALLALALIDWDTTLLPDSITQPLLWAGLILAALGVTGLPLKDALWGAVCGYLSLWSITAFFKLVTGKEGMGQGDFKLLAVLGVWLGPSMLLPIVLGASVLGAVVGIAMKMAGTLREGRYVPFGPFLAGGGAVVLLAGQERVMQWMGWA